MTMEKNILVPTHIYNNKNYMHKNTFLLHKKDLQLRCNIHT